MKTFFLAVTLASALVLAGVDPSIAQAASYRQTSAPVLSWGSCDAPRLVEAGAECGTVPVPLDYAHPDGVQIELAVSRVLHTVPDAQYQGVMLVNPGGPGASGLTQSLLGQFVPGGVGNAYDWIGFDPRGVGSSIPALSCDPDYFTPPATPYEPASAWIEWTNLRQAKVYAADCATAGGELLRHLRTVDSAKDMDRIRVALGADTISFYGFSYGSYLGQVYGTLFPKRVRRMVLDGNVDPRAAWYQADLDQDIAFEKTVKIFFRWVAKYRSVYHLGATQAAVEQAYYKVYEQLKAHPVDGVLGADEWNASFLDAGYYVFDWTDIAEAFASFVNDHDPVPMEEFAAGVSEAGDDNGYAVYSAVGCTDAPSPTSWTTRRNDAARTYRVAPFLTWSNTWYDAPCMSWSVPAHNHVAVNGAAVGPVLLISETFDAATPYEGSLEVRRRFPLSILVEGVGGSTHAGSLFGVACVDNTVAAYLATGELPPRKAGRRSDRQCPPTPQPEPEVSPRLAARIGGTPALTRSELVPRTPGRG
ncbi:MAG: peptidase [Marmoricola sp.]|nr:peptidase [Marmoricola sp.]